MLIRSNSERTWNSILRFHNQTQTKQIFHISSSRQTVGKQSNDRETTIQLHLIFNLLAETEVPLSKLVDEEEEVNPAKITCGY